MRAWPETLGVENQPSFLKKTAFMDLPISVLCVNSRSCFFSKAWQAVHLSEGAAGIAAGAADPGSCYPVHTGAG